MATVTAPRLLTADEYEHLDEVIGFRDELIEGERVLSPSPILPHTAVIEQLERILRSQLAEFGCAVVYREGDQLSTPFRADVDEVFAVLD